MHSASIYKPTSVANKSNYLLKVLFWCTLLSGLFLTTQKVTAQNTPLIVAAEYFFNTDPGFGNGSSINIGSPDSTIEISGLNIPLNTLTPGQHQLYIRVKNDSGAWSLTYHAPVIVLENTNAQADLTQAEYFFDTDPGFSNGINWGSLSPGQNLNLSGLNPGKHYLYIRVKNQLGKWSHVFHTPIIVDTNSTQSTLAIAEAEYYFDTDPGYGNANTWPAFTPDSVVHLSENLNLTGLAPGLHRLHVRTKNENGKWSHDFNMPVMIDTSSSLSAKKITEAEYFIDTDPGYGNATPFSPLTPSSVQQITKNIDLSNLNPGNHRFYARVKDETGKWSQVYHSTFNIKNSDSEMPLIGLEYFYNSDPGFGNGQFIAFSNPAYTVDEQVNLALCGLSNGTHKLYFRTIDSLGKWSHIYHSDVTVTNDGLPSALSANVSNSGPVCPGGTLDLQVSGALNATALWTGPSGFSQYGDTVSISNFAVADTGYYYVTVDNGCEQILDSTYVETTTAPTAQVIGDTLFCVGTQTVLTALGGVSYQWSNGSTNDTAQLTQAGVYTVTVTDAGGCSSLASVTVDTLSLPNAQITGVDSICSGTSTTFTATGGSSYTWNTGALTPSITVNSAGTYSVTVTDTNSCSESASKMLYLTNNLPVSASISGIDTICAGDTTLFTTSGGNLFTWNTGATTASISVSTPGMYKVTVSNSGGCSTPAVDSLELVTITSPTASVTGPTDICSNDTAALFASGGDTYSWSTGSALDSNLISSGGNYTVTVSLNNGCFDTTSYNVNSLTAPTASISGSDTIALGTSTTYTASGGGTYSWSTGATTASINVSTPGTYSVTVTSPNNCSDVAQKTLYVPGYSVITAAEYFWDNDPGYGNGNSWPSFTVGGDVSLSTNLPLTGLSPGLHTLHIRTKDNEGKWSLNYHTKVMIDTQNMSAPTEVLAAEYFWNNDPGFGNANPLPAFTASETVSLVNNLPLNGLNPGQHKLYLRTKDNKGKWSLNYYTTVMIDTNTTSSAPNIVEAEYYFDTDPGYGNGTPWNTFSPNESVSLNNNLNLSSLTPGLHRLYIRTKNENGKWSHDFNTPVMIDTASSSNPLKIVATEYYLDNDPGYGNGTPLGSYSPDSVIAVNSNINLSGQSKGLHRLYVRSKDENGKWSLDFHAPFVVKEENEKALITGIEYFWDTDPGFGNGTFIAVNNPDSIVALAENIPACGLSDGLHRLFIRALDDEGKWSLAYHSEVNISNTGGAGSLSIAANSNSPVCIGGTLELEVNGALGATVSWTGPNGFLASDSISRRFNISSADSGYYYVTVDDGCSQATDSVYVNTNNLPTVSLTGDTAICNGTNGTLNSSAATSYLWNTGASSQSISVSTAGNYSVTISDANGCEASDTQSVQLFPTPVVNITGADSICPSSNTIYTASGGSTYSWSTGENTASITVSSAATYSVTATDVNGCTATASKTLSINSGASINAVVTGNDTICNGETTTLTASGGNAFNWSTGETTASITVNTGGVYAVTISSSGGCSTPDSTSITVTELASPNVSITGNDTICSGDTTVLYASGGIDYQWSTGSNLDSVIITSAGSYIVTVTNANTCSSTDTQIVVVNSLPIAQINGVDSIQAGNSTVFTASGGSSYQWNTGDTTTTITVSNIGNYQVTVTDTNGCSSVTDKTLNVIGLNVILAAEYYWDTDPGYGNGTPVPVNNPDSVVSLSPNISMAGLSPGQHRLHFRTQNNSGEWSHDYHKVVVVDTTSSSSSLEVIAAEYYWDNDPGYGNGTPFPAFASAESVSLSNNLSLNGLSPGKHRLHVRTKDNSGRWSHDYHSIVQVDTNSNGNNPEIVAAEYFWDTDPGFGNANPWPSFIANEAVNISQNVDLSGLNSGIHRLYVRTKDDRGKWSLAYHTPVIVDEDTTTTLPDLVSLEYFWDTDPGFGNGTSVTIPRQPVIDEDITFSTCGLSATTHKLYVRVKDENGKWSLTYHSDVLISGSGGGSITINLSSNGPVCENDTAFLSVNNISGASYNWSGPNGYSDTTQNPIIANATITQTGYYLVDVDDGCARAIDSLYLEVNPQITLNNWLSDTTLCVPDTFLAEANYSGGQSVNYQWSSGETVSSISIHQAGTYSVTVSDLGNACSTSDTVTVQENITSPRVWTGDIDQNWGKHKNWTCGGVPDSATDVVIPDVRNGSNNTPIILPLQNFEVKTILFQPNSEFRLRGKLEVMN